MKVFSTEIVLGDDSDIRSELVTALLLVITALMLHAASSGFTYYYLYGIYVIYRIGLFAAEVV